MIYDPIEVGLKTAQKRRGGFEVVNSLTTDAEYMNRLQNKNKWGYKFLTDIAMEYLKNPDFIPSEKQYQYLLKLEAEK